MTITNASIGTNQRITQGDALEIRRTLTNMPTSRTLAQGWLTVKFDRGDADPGVFQKNITTTDVPGTGQIENDGTGGANPVLRFDVTAANTLAITRPAWYDIQVITDTGDVYTVESGKFFTSPGVTGATS